MQVVGVVVDVVVVRIEEDGDDDLLHRRTWDACGSSRPSQDALHTKHTHRPPSSSAKRSALHIHRH
jgi:hypothetical protein